MLFRSLFADGDHITSTNGIGRNVHLAAVHFDSAVADELAGFRARRAKAHAINDVVKAALKELQELFASVAAKAGSLSEIAAELPFENAVHALGLLRFTHLVAIVRRAGSGNLTVLARLGTDVLDFGLKRTTGALQIQINAFATRKLEQIGRASCRERV